MGRSGLKMPRDGRLRFAPYFARLFVESCFRFFTSHWVARASSAQFAGVRSSDFPSAMPISSEIRRRAEAAEGLRTVSAVPKPPQVTLNQPAVRSVDLRGSMPNVFFRNRALCSTQVTKEVDYLILTGHCAPTCLEPELQVCPHDAAES